MSLAKGTRLGPYEISAPLGSGGMGEVYRARDTRLDRFVALKILHSEVADTPELRSRFQREARVLSSLSHPHICSLYDVGSEAQTEFLVMELLEGETLSARLQRGPLPISAVVKLGMEIADALAKAHRHGVIHRDLKPSNMMLTANGAKLMDFGLAKPAISAGGSVAVPSLAELATATMKSPSTPLSTVGTLIGTIQYMAPEQIEGKEADERSDIFALGVVLYEALTGHRAFEGKTHLSVASAILQKDPPPLSLDRAEFGLSHLEYIIRACVTKNPDDRPQAAQDVKLQLNWLLQASADRPKTENRAPAVLLAMGAAIVLLLATVVLLARELRNRPLGASSGILQFRIPLPARQELAVNNGQSVVMSPDGRALAYVAADNGAPRLYVLRLDQVEPVAIADSGGASFPFFSPNGDWIAFFSQGKLKKAPASGGVPIVICEIPTFFGGTWTPQDTIVVAVPNYGFATVPASGGLLQRVSIATKDIIYPEGPNWLPGGDWVAFTDYLARRRSVMALNLKTGEVRSILNNAQGAYYSAGRLVYFQGGAMWAVPIDTKSLSATGKASLVTSGVNEENYIAQASLSSNGVLAYAPGPASDFGRNLYLVDRQGQEKKIDVQAQDYVDSVISPDGKHIATMIRSVTSQQLVVLDRDRGIVTTLVDQGLCAAPAWMPDGKSLMFDSLVSGKRAIYRVAASGSSAPEFVRTAILSSHITSIAAGYAAVMVNDPVNSTDIWLLNLQNPQDMRPFKATSAAERQAALSPDAHWLAYESNESGRPEIYVEPVPGPGGRRQISTGGGEEPRWVRNGREITYRVGSRMIAVPVQTQPTFQAGKPVELFDRKFDRGFGVAGYDVTPDGQTFVMTRSEHAPPSEIRVVMGWAGHPQPEQ